MTVVELNDVSFERNGRRILDRVNWRIARGENWALIGSNGSGKTTLLKIISGYEWPTSGSVTVLGARYGECDLRVHRRQIGWVSASIEQRFPQGDTGLEIAASGIDATLGLCRSFTAHEWDRAEEALSRMSASPLCGQVFRTMSQGEQQRVLIARALAGQPALLVLDEPCAGLDPVARASFLGDVGRLAALPNAPALVFVSHHIEEIRPWFSHALALHRGRVEAAGSAASVVTSATLSRVFEQPCTVTSADGQFTLRVRAKDLHTRGV